MENVEVLEIGGPQTAKIRPETLERALIVHITDLAIVETKWGKRVEFSGIDKETGFGIAFSSWNFESKAKFKPADILGKDVKITPKNEKRFFLTPL